MNNISIENNPIAARLLWFIEAVNKGLAIHWNNMQFSHNSPPKIMIEAVGKKYIRLVNCKQVPAHTGPYFPDGVYCFVNATNGDVLKAASYKAPAPNGVRGNINDADILSKATPYGLVYLRGLNVGDSIHNLLAMNGV